MRDLARGGVDIAECGSVSTQRPSPSHCDTCPSTPLKSLPAPVPHRSTQPCITLGSLNRVPASAGVRAGMSPLPGGR